jgi:hypothetical protein
MLGKSLDNRGAPRQGPIRKDGMNIGLNIVLAPIGLVALFT